MSLKISRILHAGYVFESGETQIAFDTIFENPFSRNCHAFPAVEFDREAIRKLRFSAVFISHHHDDHCSLESLDLLDRATPIYLYCIHDELFDWIRELGFISVHPLVLNQAVTVGPFTVTPWRALDADVDSMFQIEAEGVNVLNVVDSWIDDDTLKRLARQKWDMILWPFQTMREIEVIAPSTAVTSDGLLPSEWVDQLRVLKPRIVVPSSCQFKLEEWSWYNHAFFPITYAGFRDQIEQALPLARVVRMNPGTSVALKSQSENEAERFDLAEPLPWIRPIGPQDLDYDYQPRAVPTATSEIARQFAPLDAKKTALVLSFCQQGLLEKFRTLELSEEPFFAKPVSWRLVAFDHEGVAHVFRYQLEGLKIELVGGSTDERIKPDWETEIPLTKLWSAIEDGESLTSLYMRIKAPPDVDIVEDPLIRVLFTRSFGAYQQAQLRRLKLG